MVGAGSVVTKDIPPYTVWYGNPAKQRGYITLKGEILDMEMKNSKGEIVYAPELTGGGNLWIIIELNPYTAFSLVA